MLSERSEILVILEVRLQENLSYLRPKIVNDMIRCGNKGDGGYVLASSVLESANVLISFGIGTDTSFEVCLHKKRQNITIHAYDHSVDSIKLFFWCAEGVVNYLIGRTNLADFKIRLIKFRNYLMLFRGKNKHFHQRVCHTLVDNKRDIVLADVFSRISDFSNAILKMDIEGDEYSVIPDLLKFSNKVDLMIIEFHETNKFRSLFEKQVNAILQSFNIVHLHGNNFAGIAPDGLPVVLEITFLNKRFTTTENFRSTLPLVGLDFPNDPTKPDFIIHFE